MRGARPNPAHEALARLEAVIPRFMVATQNIDDLHRRASTRQLCELHGNAFRERCLDFDCEEPAWSSPVVDTSDELPHCRRCGSVARPDVVLFGEGADQRWAPVRDFVAGGVEVVLLVGTSGVVEVPTELTTLARSRGAVWIVEINPRPTNEGELAARIEMLGSSLLPRRRCPSSPELLFSSGLKPFRDGL